MKFASGYWKDRNTNQVKLHPEAAVTVQIIYSLYLQGCGQKEIARRLNAMGRKTPAQLRAEQCGREFRITHKTRDGKFLWTYASVKNVLVEEAYTGVLNNHRSETNGGKVKRLAEKEWYRHEDFYPIIIEREEWEQAQDLLKQQARPANGNQAKHRYAGLLACQECGNPFVPMIRYWNGNRRVEYVCKGYHRSGKDDNVVTCQGNFPCDKNGMPILRWTSLKVENPAAMSFSAQKSRAGELRIQLGPLTTIHSLEPSEGGDCSDEDFSWTWVQVYAGPQTMYFDHIALKAFRLESGMTQKAVADAIGASVRTYQKWEKGETTPDGHYLLRIMNWLNIDSVQQLTRYLKVNENVT